MFLQTLEGPGSQAFGANNALASNYQSICPETLR
jgi:hypothetical protein